MSVLYVGLSDGTYQEEDSFSEGVLDTSPLRHATYRGGELVIAYWYGGGYCATHIWIRPGYEHRGRALIELHDKCIEYNETSQEIEDITSDLHKISSKTGTPLEKLHRYYIEAQSSCAPYGWHRSYSSPIVIAKSADAAIMIAKDGDHDWTSAYHATEISLPTLPPDPTDAALRSRLWSEAEKADLIP